MDTTTITMVEKNEEGKGKNPFGHLFRHVYVINLLSDVARRDNMIRQLKELGIPNEAIQMVNAVDGQNEDLSLYDYETAQEWVEPFSKRAITRGEIGCALSHYGVWKHLIASGDDRSLILEDDVVINIAEFKKENPVYTGDKVLGVSIVHKSCLQPVFSETQAKDFASMRR